LARHFSNFYLNMCGIMLFNNVQEIKGVLTCRIFTLNCKESYVFDEDSFAILEGDLRLLIRRNNIVLENIQAKHKYSIFKDGSDFIFRTYENEISPAENEFIFLMKKNENETLMVSLVSLTDKKELKKLLSD
jgi:hypothetical protein